jgi:prepilin peptidase CpaA
LQTFLSFVGTTLFIVAAYTDVKSFRIPNTLVAGMASLGIIRLIVLGDPSIALYTVAASAVLLIIGLALFALGYFGGGDAKLITAAALLVSYNHLFSFLLIMSICGAVLSLVVLAIHKYLPLYAGPRLATLLPKNRLAVPYGVAIAAAGSVTLFFQIPLTVALFG